MKPKPKKPPDPSQPHVLCFSLPPPHCSSLSSLPVRFNALVHPLIEPHLMASVASTLRCSLCCLSFAPVLPSRIGPDSLQGQLFVFFTKSAVEDPEFSAFMFSLGGFVTYSARWIVSSAIIGIVVPRSASIWSQCISSDLQRWNCRAIDSSNFRSSVCGRPDVQFALKLDPWTLAPGALFLVYGPLRLCANQISLLFFSALSLPPFAYCELLMLISIFVATKPDLTTACLEFLIIEIVAETVVRNIEVYHSTSMFSSCAPLWCGIKLLSSTASAACRCVVKPTLLGLKTFAQTAFGPRQLYVYSLLRFLLVMTPCAENSLRLLCFEKGVDRIMSECCVIIIVAPFQVEQHNGPPSRRSPTPWYLSMMNLTHSETFCYSSFSVARNRNISYVHSCLTICCVDNNNRKFSASLMRSSYFIFPDSLTSWTCTICFRMSWYCYLFDIDTNTPVCGCNAHMHFWLFGAGSTAVELWMTLYISTCTFYYNCLCLLLVPEFWGNVEIPFWFFPRPSLLRPKNDRARSQNTLCRLFARRMSIRISHMSRFPLDGDNSISVFHESCMLECTRC